MEIKKTPQEIWAEFEECNNYNQSIRLSETVKKNEDFFSGKQWEGVNAPDLEKPVLNFLRRVVTYFISMIVSDDVAVSVTPFFQTGENELAAKILSAEVERVIERTGAKALHRDALRDAAVDGDGCFYLYFDPEAETGQTARGEICIETVDNTKVLFGNPYVSQVQKQPYLLLVRRDSCRTVRERAEAHGMDPKLIVPDNAQRYYGEDKTSAQELVTCVLKLWRDPQSKTIRFLETTQGALVRPETDTGYQLYPVAFLPWEKAKGSYHGISPITGLIPNQICVNKLWAMAMQHQKLMAFPKVFYDNTKIKSWNNRVGQAVAVAGNPNDAVASAFRAPDMSGQVLDLVERTISMTRDFMGASDAALGNIKPDNTSAIIAVQKASSAPLELQRLAFYQFVEDYVRVLIDMIRVHYGVRLVSLELENGTEAVAFDFSSVDYDGMQMKVDVGSSAYWSELMQIQTMDNLFQKGIIADAVTYLEGIPDTYLKNKNKILSQLRQRQAQMQTQLQMLQGGVPDGGNLPQM